MVDQLMSGLAGWEVNIVADMFLVVIGGLFIVALYEIKKGRHQPFIQFSPTLLTSLGILGTFTGISIGLANFDYGSQAAIDKSIPQLLGGLKMAFFTSIAGMATSLLAKSYATWKSKTTQVTEESVGALELYQSLQEQNDILDQVRRSIAGEGDASVVTQLQKVRTDLQDGIRETRNSLVGDSAVPIASQLRVLGEQQVATREVIKAIHTEQVKMRSAIAGEGDASVVTQLQRMRTDLKEFAEKVSEIGSKQLVEALNELIRDFNEKLTEQFGENFRRLDESVKKLVDWQDQYRLQMEAMREEFDIAVKGIDGSRDSLQQIRQEVESIPALMAQLGSLMTTSQSQLEDMERHLAAFSDMRDKAVDAMPLIKEKLEETMNTVAESVTAASKHYEVLITDSSEYIDTFESSVEGLHEKFVNETTEMIDWITTHLKDTANGLIEQNNSAKDALINASGVLEQSLNGAAEEMKKFVQDASSEVSEQIQTAFAEQNGQARQLVSALREEAQKAAAERTDILNQELKEMDRAMQGEISRVMQEMANPLVQITSKFVSDYTGLTEHMSEVINRNRRVQHEDRNV